MQNNPLSLSVHDAIASMRARVSQTAKAPLKFSEVNDLLAKCIFGRPYSAVIAAERAGRLPPPFASPAANTEALAKLTTLADAPDGATWEAAIGAWIKELLGEAAPAADVDVASALSWFESILENSAEHGDEDIVLRVPVHAYQSTVVQQRDAIGIRASVDVSWAVGRRVAEALAERCHVSWQDMSSGSYASGHFEFSDASGRSCVVTLSAVAWSLGLAHRLQYEVCLGLHVTGALEAVSMTAMGFSAEHIETIERTMRLASGLVLFSGSATESRARAHAAHAALRYAAEQRKSTVEVPDPADWPDAPLSQVPPLGNKSPFTDALCAIMRADPDVILVPEIRSLADAEEALRVARSGHLCVPEIDAASAADALLRLNAMGVSWARIAEPVTLAASVYVERLPTLCPACRIPLSMASALRKPLSKKTMDWLGYIALGAQGVAFRNECGCSVCEGRGYAGTTVCVEILTNRELIGRQPSEVMTPESLVGQRTYVHHALSKVKLGIVSPLDVETAFGVKVIDEAIAQLMLEEPREYVVEQYQFGA